MALHRRTFLAGSGAAAATLAGCQGVLPGDRPRMDVAFANYTDTVQPLNLEVLREDRSEYHDALVLDRTFEVPPPEGEESAGTLRQADAVPRRKYLFRVLLRNGRFESFQYQYYPGETMSDPESAEIIIRIYRDEGTGNLYVRFY